MINPEDNQSGQIAPSTDTSSVAVTVHSGAVDFYHISAEQLDQLVTGNNILSTGLATAFLGLSSAFFLSWFTGCTANIGGGVIPALAVVFTLFTVGFGIAAVKGFFDKKKQIGNFKKPQSKPESTEGL